MNRISIGMTNKNDDICETVFNLITILGPTATGKTILAANLANRIGGEIISADSRQVYRGMDIGTGKDLDDYIVHGEKIPYYLVDIADPGYEYNVFEFKHDFLDAFDLILAKGKQAIFCGGTGMYLDAVLRNYSLQKVPLNKTLRKNLESFSQEELVGILEKYGILHNTTDLTERERTIRAIEIADFQSSNPKPEKDFSEINSLNFGIRFERQTIRERITERLKERLSNGMIEEVKGLLDGGLRSDQLTFYGLEYSFVTQYIIGELTYDEMFTRLNTAIHQFAKRQMTWFRRMEKKGIEIHWIDGELSMEKKVDTVEKLLRF